MKALVVAGGDVTPPVDVAAARDGQSGAATDDRTLVIAADGGLLNARALGLAVALLVGDGDSLAPATIDALGDEGIEFRRHPVDKDASDTELAVREALDRGAMEVAVLGALGGLRFDHALANVLLLADPTLAAVPVTIVDGDTIVRVLEAAEGGADLEIRGSEGDVVSLLPLSREVRGVTLAGLRYLLQRATLLRGSSLGLSNVLAADRATVHLDSGCLVVVHVRQGATS